MNISRGAVINYLCDCMGYGADDFENMSTEDIIEIIIETPERKAELIEYNR